MYFIVIALHQFAFSETEIVTKCSLLAAKLYLSCVSCADLFPFAMNFRAFQARHSMSLLFRYAYFVYIVMKST